MITEKNLGLLSLFHDKRAIHALQSIGFRITIRLDMNYPGKVEVCSQNRNLQDYLASLFIMSLSTDEANRALYSTSMDSYMKYKRDMYDTIQEQYENIANQVIDGFIDAWNFNDKLLDKEYMGNLADSIQSYYEKSIDKKQRFVEFSELESDIKNEFYGNRYEIAKVLEGCYIRVYYSLWQFGLYTFLKSSPDIKRVLKELPNNTCKVIEIFDEMHSISDIDYDHKVPDSKITSSVMFYKM